MKKPKNIKTDEKEKEKEEKINFWKKIKIAIKDFDRYQDLAAEKVTTVLGYLCKLILIFAMIATALAIYSFHTSLQNVLQQFDETISKMEIKNGTLTVEQEEVIRMENIALLDGKIIIDTKTDDDAVMQGYIQEIKQTNDSVVFLKDRIVYKNSLLSQPIEYSYTSVLEELGKEQINKEDILNYASNENLVVLYTTLFGFMFIYFFLIYFASTFVDVMLLSVLGYVTSKVTGMKIRYSALFNMGVYAITLSVILNLVYLVIHSLTGFEIQYFQVMYTAISYIYMITAILLIKSDLIKKQMELMKIQEEQERIREELKRKEIEEQQRQEEEERKKKREEKQKQEEKKEEPKVRKPRKKKSQNEEQAPQGNA